jgi:hypothetical protein
MTKKEIDAILENIKAIVNKVEPKNKRVRAGKK